MPLNPTEETVVRILNGLMVETIDPNGVGLQNLCQTAGRVQLNLMGQIIFGVGAFGLIYIFDSFNYYGYTGLVFLITSSPLFRQEG